MRQVNHRTTMRQSVVWKSRSIDASFRQDRINLCIVSSIGNNALKSQAKEFSVAFMVSEAKYLGKQETFTKIRTNKIFMRGNKDEQ